MKIKEILRELQYYLSIRQTGKTTLLKKGIDEYPYYHWIVVPTIEYGKKMIIPSNKLHKLVSLDDIGSGNGSKIRGTQQAMIIDQEANLQIFTKSLQEIERLEQQNLKYAELVSDITDLGESYQTDLHEIQNHIMEGLRIPFWNLKRKWEYRNKSIKLAKYGIEKSKDYSRKFDKLKSYFPLEK